MSTEQGDVEAIREALSSPFRDGWRDALAALDRLAAALAEKEQAWEDMRAYNIRLEERVREAERALAEIIEVAIEGDAEDLADALYGVTRIARAALRPSESNDA